MAKTEDYKDNNTQDVTGIILNYLVSFTQFFAFI